MAASTSGQEPVDFNRDVRPILSDKCFACHGPDAGSREAGLRLDTREGALASDGRGRAAIVPGDWGASELARRTTSDLAGELMPPPESHKQPLDGQQLATLRAWIEAGAPWAKHWAFVPPRKQPLPAGEAHPIDAWVGARLAAEGLAWSEPAAVSVLARRMSFDLTGLPPRPERVAALGPSPDEDAWGAYVDELLDSPHYGERMAMWWLDGARYADTDGFQQDEVRQNWPWRDWVVQAFQSGMPFDRFTVEQFAGDLLPEASAEQILATCFQRNHMHNGEGGRDPEESRVDYVRDRTNTIGTDWLGMTLECAQCHDHKFDPVGQADYYSLSAYFNSIDESGHAGGRAKPFLKWKSPYGAKALERARAESEAAGAALASLRESARSEAEAWLEERREQARAGLSVWTPLQATSLRSAEGSLLAQEANGEITCRSGEPAQEDFLVEIAPTDLERVTALQLEFLPEADGSLSFALDGEFILTNVKLRVLSEGLAAVRELELDRAVAAPVGEGIDKQYGPPRGVLDDDPRTGWTTRGQPVEGAARLVVALKQPLVLAPGERLECALLFRSTVPAAHARRLRLFASDQPGKAVRSLDPMPMERLARLLQADPSAQPDDQLAEDLLDQYLEDRGDWREARRRQGILDEQRRAAEAAAGELQVTVLSERAEPRKTYVLERGVWDDHGHEVARSVPAALFAEGPRDVRSRLELGRWIVDRRNPLTARVITNQIWQQLFGRGLVRTPADFGLQGARPSHPELLDWLAVDWMEQGWDLRQLLRSIVSSRTYRQSSRSSAQLTERDPSNELLARGARFRLPSWMLRDAALAASGLLEREVGGPPIYPHQPPGVWEDVFMGRFRYKPTMGRSRFRRTLYAFWRRNAPPTYLFDSAPRRTCEVDRRLTNTPLQALTMLNDATYVEAARELASRALDASPGSLDEQLQAMGQRVLSRNWEADELAVLGEVHGRARQTLAADPAQAEEHVRPSAESADPRATHHAAEELAALSVVASLILNLDEAQTHE